MNEAKECKPAPHINEVYGFVHQLLLEKGPLPPNIALDQYCYLDNGHIDSLAFIKYIFRIEEQFAIQFLPEEMSSGEIRSVGGLVALIMRKLT